MRDFEELLSYFPEGKWKGEEYVAPCPIPGCHHRTPHLYIKMEGNKAVMFCQKCHAKGTDIMGALGLPKNFLFIEDQRQPVRRSGTRDQARTSPVTGAQQPQKKERKPRIFPDIPQQFYKDKASVLERQHTYTDEDGKVISYKVIYRNPSTREKYCQWWSPVDGGYVSGTNHQKIPLYNIEKLSQHSEPLVFVVEGEKDCETMAAMSMCAVSTPNGGGQARWEDSFSEALRCRDVVVITDNDSTGEKYGQYVAKNLEGVANSVRILPAAQIHPGIQPKGDITDIMELIGKDNTVGEIEEAMDNAAQTTAPTATGSLLESFADVKYEPPRFLLPPYFPVGKITIVQGDPGVGKTSFLCAIAAKVSTGAPLIDAPCSAGNVIMVSVEDDPAVLRGRIEASGGDVNRCFFIKDAATKGITFTSPEIEAAIREAHAKMIVFDPLQCFLGAIDMNKANETRPILAALAEMANRNDCAVVLIAHQSKGQTKSIYKALGSIDIVGSSRSMIQIGRDPDVPDQCVAVHVKSSNAKNGQSIRYQIVDRGGIEWLGYTDLTAEDLEREKKRQALGIDYDDEPVVAVCRAILADNPKGVFISFDGFQRFGDAVLGYPPAIDSRDLGKKLRALVTELMRKDKIRVEVVKDRAKDYIRQGHRVEPETQAPVRGVKIVPYMIPKDFQTSMDVGV